MKRNHPSVIARRSALPPPDGVRDAIVDRFVAGDTIALLAWDYEMHELMVEACLREALRKRRGRKGGKGG